MLGKAIKALREEQHINQGELAVKIGLTREQVNRIEKGRHNPTSQNFAAICDALGVTAEDVYVRVLQLTGHPDLDSLKREVAGLEAEHRTVQLEIITGEQERQRLTTQIHLLDRLQKTFNQAELEELGRIFDARAKRLEDREGAPPPTPAAQEDQTVSLLRHLQAQVVAIAQHVGAPILATGDAGRGDTIAAADAELEGGGKPKQEPEEPSAGTGTAP